MSGFLSGLNEWSTSYAHLDTAEDYIEWTFTLASDEAAIMNAGGPFAFSSRTTSNLDHAHRVSINGFFVLNELIHGDFGLDFFWNTFLFNRSVGTGVNNIFFTGTNKLRVQTLPGFVDHVDIDFIALELDMSDFGDPPLPPFDFYGSTEDHYFSDPGTFPPSWYAGHSNPTYDHSTADQSQPTYIFKAPDGVIGHATEANPVVTSAVRTSSNSPLTSPLVLDLDVDIESGATGILSLAQLDPIDGIMADSTWGMFFITSTVSVGGAAAFTISLPFTPPSNDSGGVYLYYNGDATHYSLTPGGFAATVQSPEIVDVTITQTGDYTYHFVPVYQGDIFASGTYTAFSQIPTDLYWSATDTFFHGFGSGDGSGATFTHEYAHYHAFYDGLLVTSGDFDPDPGGGNSTFIINIETQNALGWLHFSSSQLNDPTIRLFTGLPLKTGPMVSFIEGPFQIEADRTRGYVMLLGGDNSEHVYSFAPTGGARVADHPIGLSTVPTLGYSLWAFDSDFVHAWGVSGLSFPLALTYGTLGGAATIVREFIGDPLRGESFATAMSVDKSSGLLYLLWINPMPTVASFIDQIDRTGNIRKTYTLGGPTGPGSGLASTIAASGGIIFAGGEALDGTTLISDAIWKIHAGSGAGADNYAFTSGAGHQIYALDFNGGGGSPLRQKQRDDGLGVGNGPRVSVGANSPTSHQGSIRQGGNNTYW